MAKTGKFIHAAPVALNTAATTTFAVARSVAIPIHPEAVNPNMIRARLSALYITVDTIAAGATALTIRICSDANGDAVLFGDSAATLSIGVTTATVGSATYKIDVDYVDPLVGSLYLFWKTDVGTCSVRTASISWEE